jgi:hypothetical protein
MKEIKDYVYPENLTTLQIITSDNQNTYSERNENIEDYAQNMITNEDIQKIRIVDGELSDYLFDSDSIDTIANMISFYF